MSSIINGFIILSLIITFAFFCGLLTLITSNERNDCEMTFMYEFPQFVRIWTELDDKYPKYGLYAYSEGRLTEKTRNMYFDGIPVVFIPGNAGSHRQGRSFASVALRKAYDSRSPFHFDFFSIDLNDELSCLNGALLYDQLHYVNTSISKILEMYKGRKNRPNSIVIIGHSMGGVLARRLIIDLPDDSQLIPIVVTLASPHRRPPVMLDSFSYSFYNEIESNRSKPMTTFVSISGGNSDVLVPVHLTMNPQLDSLNVVSTHIPRSWVPADHVCISWCKQIVLAITRALFESVDRKTKQISTNPKLIRSVFNHHLVHHSGIKSDSRDKYDITVQINNHGEWIENMGRQYRIRVPINSPKTQFYMVRLLQHAQHEALTVIALNLEVVDWVFVCGAHIPTGNSRICEDFTHLTHLSEIAPSTLYKRRSITINMHQLLKNNPDWTHVIFRVPPTDEKVFFYVDVYNENERKVTVNLPNLYSFKKQIIINETLDKAVHYELDLPQLQRINQFYQLFVDAVECAKESRHAVASLQVPWGYQDQHKFFTKSEVGPLLVRLYSPRPQWASNQSAKIKLTLDPMCRYRISLRSWLPGVLSQLSYFYSPLLLVNMAAVILMGLNSQLKSLGETKSCSCLFTAIKDGAKPYYILTSVKLISRILSVKPFTNILPVPDWVVMADEGIDFFLLPLLLYICSVGIVWISAVVLCCSMVCFEATVHKWVLRFLARTVSFTFSWSDHLMTALHKLPFVVAGALMCLCFTTTGALALCVGLIVYFMRLTQLSQDYIEALVWSYLRKFGAKFKRAKPKNDEASQPDKKDDNGDSNNSSNKEPSPFDAIFFHATLFLLWSLITIVNIPSVLTWAHNYKFSTALKPDPAFLPGLILSVCALPLWQLETPKVQRQFYMELGQFMSVLAVIVLIYAPISVFRLNYIVTTAFVVVTLHQLLAPNRNEEDSRPERSMLSYDALYDTIKAKLE